MPVANHALEFTTAEYGYVGVFGFFLSLDTIARWVERSEDGYAALDRAVIWLREAECEILVSCWLIDAIDPRTGNRRDDTVARRVVLSAYDRHVALLTAACAWWRGAEMVRR